MGDTGIQPPATSTQEDQMSEPLRLVDSTYSVIAYPAKELPKQYEPMIYSKWLRSLKFGNPAYKCLESSVYYKGYHDFIEKLMAKPDSVVRLAVLTDDQDIALGFSVAREDVLDYVHVQKDYRRQGIAKKLLPPKVTMFTHFTLVAGEIWRGNYKYRHLKFDPKV